MSRTLGPIDQSSESGACASLIESIELAREVNSRAMKPQSGFNGPSFGSVSTRAASVVGALVLAPLSVAFAQAQGGAGGAPASPLLNLVPFLVMLGIMYFLMIRPQIRKQKQHQDFVSQLKRGDEVVTSGGILGRIEGLTDLFVTLEIAPGVRIKILRSQIASTGAAVSATESKSEVKA